MPSSIDVRIRSRESPAEPARAFMVAVWEAIRRSVLERGRDFRQRRRRLVEQDGYDQPLSNSDDPLRFAEPQFEEPSDLAVQGKVKWFNPRRRVRVRRALGRVRRRFPPCDRARTHRHKRRAARRDARVAGGSGAAGSAGDRGHQCGQQHRGPVQTTASEF
jgi:hypothetical protein